MLSVNRQIFAIVLSLLVLGGASNLLGQGTAFTYQGRLNDAGQPANGVYDLHFAVYDAYTNGTRVSAWLTNSAVAVSNGLFATSLDFGDNIFTGTNYWLDIAVRKTGDTDFTTLWPRQPILPTPYAIFANTSSNVLGTIGAGQITGTLPASQVSGTSASQVSFINSANTFSGTFSGNGATLTNLNGSQITTGTVADERLSPNVALLDHDQTFSGANTFTNWSNSFSGSFFGNGLVGWVSVSGTSQQAERDHGYMLTSASLTTVTLPPNSGLTNGDIVRVSGVGSGGWLIVQNSGQSIMGNLNSYHNAILQTGNTGSDWRDLASSSDGARMYACGNFAGGIYTSSDYGHSWNPVTGVAGGSWYSIACSSDGITVYAAANGGAVIKSVNAGATWSTFSSSSSWNAIACSADGSNIIAGASSGALALTTGTSPASGNYTAVACSGDFSHLAASIGNKVYTSINKGSSWRNTTLPSTCSDLAAAVDGSKLVATYAGGIATSTDFGQTWVTTTPGPTSGWKCIAASSDCTRIIAGINGGLLYASANFGQTWTSLTTTNQNWSGAGMSYDGSKFAATVNTVGGVYGGIYASGINAQPNIISTNSSISGSQGSAVELQYIGNGQFMPVSSTGTIWAN